MNVDDPKTTRALGDATHAIREEQLDPKLPRVGAEGDTFYRDDAGRIAALSVGNTGDILTVQEGVPVWEPAASAGLPADWGTVP